MKSKRFKRAKRYLFYTLLFTKYQISVFSNIHIHIYSLVHAMLSLTLAEPVKRHRMCRIGGTVIASEIPLLLSCFYLFHHQYREGPIFVYMQRSLLDVFFLLKPKSCRCYSINKNCLFTMTY